MGFYSFATQISLNIYLEGVDMNHACFFFAGYQGIKIIGHLLDIFRHQLRGNLTPNPSEMVTPLHPPIISTFYEGAMTTQIPQSMIHHCHMSYYIILQYPWICIHISMLHHYIIISTCMICIHSEPLSSSPVFPSGPESQESLIPTGDEDSGC